MNQHPQTPSRRQQLSKALADMKAYYQRSPRLKRAVWQRKIGPAFWTISSLLSLTVNIILIAILLLLGRQLFFLKSVIADQLVDGLHTNFVLMDQAHIMTTINVNDNIQVDDTIPVVFDLPINKDTEVVLVEDVPIYGATIYLNQVPVPLDILLPAGTALNISLDLVVPISQTVPVLLDVPVNLTVPVDIPLDQTQLHDPFVGLQGVVSPYQGLLKNLPESWEETPLCGPWTRWICELLFGIE